MKVSKTDFVDFLQKISLKGLIQEVVIEENGMVATVPQSKEHNQDCTIFGTFDGLGIKARIGLGDVALLAKIVGSLETADNLVNIDLQDKSLIIAARNGKYQYRLADPDVITSIKDSYPAACTLMQSFEGLELSLSGIVNLKKAISNLMSDRVSMYAHDGVLEAVVHDDGTKSSATIELGASKKNFKNDYDASLLSKVLDTVDSDGTLLFVQEPKDEKPQPIFIQLKSKKFLYMVSPFVEVKTE
jgi:hypothetical protein